jgi:probable HAF family extracellular repeat protein
VSPSGDIAWNLSNDEGLVAAWLWRQGHWSTVDAAQVVAINAHGQAVGSVTTLSGYTTLHHAFLWQDDSLHDLGVLAQYACGYETGYCSASAAMDINENGQVVGVSADSAGRIRVVLWDNGTIRDLGLPPNPRYVGRDWHAFINNHGQIAASTATGQGFFWNDGHVRALGTLGGTIEVAGLNAHGEVVGTAVTGAGEQHVFVWSESRGMLDLGTGPHGFSDARAVGINDRGDIVGIGAQCMSHEYGRCLLSPDGYGFQRYVRAILWRAN